MMIYFACNNIDVEELIRCSFSISKTEYKIFKELTNTREKYSIEQLSRLFKKNRTTIQKAVKNLVQKNLVQRRQVNLDKGGYIYYYFVDDPERMKRRIKEIIEHWYNSAMKEIDKL